MPVRQNQEEVWRHTSLKIGIVGRPKSGKSTLFRLLTQPKGDVQAKPGHAGAGVMEIPDPRVDWLAEVFAPERKIYARAEVFDVQPWKGQEFLNSVRNLDAVIAVAGAFAASGDEDTPLMVLDDMETEFLISDLSSVEGRLERLSQRKAKPVSPMEIPFLEKCKEALESEIPLRKITFEEHEKAFLSNFAFYSLKPVIVAVNVSEDQLHAGNYPGKVRLESRADQMGYPVVVFSGEVENEIAQLPETEREEFLKAYGLTETGISRIARAAYRALGLISFFTVGEDEVRAWSIREGTTAREAAGKIHSDLERGFIRAEVVSYEDFRQAGSLKACKERGLLRLEGKDYKVKDGDIVTVRFSVS